MAVAGCLLSLVVYVFFVLGFGVWCGLCYCVVYGLVFPGVGVVLWFVGVLVLVSLFVLLVWYFGCS